jgi:succinate dehydrogenase / fumarate reductase, membrane anchor subunit
MVEKKQGHGFGDWAWQRATAITMALYTFLFAAKFIWFPPLPGYLGWRNWWSSGLFRLCSLLFLLALIYHAWLGVKEISMDYIHRVSLRTKLLKLFALILLLDALWAIRIIWSLG